MSQGINLYNIITALQNTETTAIPSLETPELSKDEMFKNNIFTKQSNPFASLLGGNLGGLGTGNLGGLGTGNFDILSLVNLFSGFSQGGSDPVSIITAITSLLNLVPFNQFIPNANGENLGIVTSIPQILNLIQNLANFKLPDPNVKI